MTSEIPSDSQNIYPGIYDFSMLPYALGDVLTWTVKTCVKASRAGMKQMDVYLCADEQCPAGIHQKKQIHASNYQWYLFDVMPAFFCNPMLRNLHLFLDRRAFAVALEQLAKNAPGAQAVIAEYENALQQTYGIYGSGKALDSLCANHAEINQFYAETGRIPQLIAPKGCVSDAADFCRAIGEEQCLVAVNFRTRERDPWILNVETVRNVNFNAWHDFMQLVGRKFPDVKFLLLGKVHEKPQMLLQLENVIVPRLCGFNLGHELALVTLSDFFMGSCSGFAVMAYFTDVPYAITQLTKRSYDCLAVAHGAKQLPFAKENQVMVAEEESLQLLLARFGDLYKARKQRTKDAPTATPLRPDEQLKRLRPAIFYNSPESVALDVKVYVRNNMQQAHRLLEAGNPAASLALLERTVSEHSGVASTEMGFQLLCALAFFQMKRFREALDAIEKELTSHPLDDSVRHFRDTVILMLRQSGAA